MQSDIKNIFPLLFFSLLLVSCNQNPTLFESLSSSKTNVSFVNHVKNKKLFSILYYLYFYNGGGVATGDINNDGLPDIYFTANTKGANKLYLNKGNFQFEDITDKAGVAGLSDWCSGVTMADVNGDGYLDIYVSTVSGRYGLKGHNELYINNKNNTFTESSEKYGLNTSCFTTQSVFFDYDQDGDLDCFILNQSHHPHANIVDTSNRRIYDSLSGDRLYRNETISPSLGGNGAERTLGTKIGGEAKFTDVSATSGIFQSNLGYGLGIAIGDMNNDGWDDIYVGNDFHENDYYYINNGNGTFKESGAKHFNHYSRFSMGNDIADYNNDGQLDLVTVDMLPQEEKILKTYGSDENADVYRVKLMFNGYQNQYSKNCLQTNNGNGTSFSENGLLSGISSTDWSWCPLFADFDNDGNKDLFISSGIVKRPVDLDYIRFVSDLKLKGADKTDKYDEQTITAMPDGSSHPYLYKGDGQMAFKDVSDDWGTGKLKGYYNGAAYCDLDNDGNLDLVINCINSPAVILKNNSPKKNFISLSFKSDDANRFGIGCKAYLFQKGKLQYQQLMLTRGFESSSDTRLHFGLDTMANIDSIVIVWPDQKYQVIKNPAANSQLIVLKNGATGQFNYNSFLPAKQETFQDITSEIKCNWKHTENDFNDFNIQYLIPHLQSTRGPKIAVGDVNGDGLDDFYACGAKLQPGSLMIQQTNGSFIATDTALFSKDAICEDVDAVFFDANGDRFPDLFVVSGGNEIPENKYSTRDRLYLNDGKGRLNDKVGQEHFTKAINFMPQLYENKSCVSVADIDHDGDIDIFVGTLANAKAFGIPQTSSLLLNDGMGHFSTAQQNIIPLSNIGIVTTAAFADINKDGWMDLIVTGEWMPLKIYINQKGSFVENDVIKSTGLWQTIYATDVNGDGYTDILAGNWGHNTKLYKGENAPFKLYVKDFDKNGSVDQILCYTLGDKQYTFLVKDELERSLPVLKKYYLTYAEVAGKSVDYIFYDLFKDYTELQAETLSSSCFINDGKGNFTRIDLPDPLQLAPIMSFTSFKNSNSTSFLAAGNFYGVIPYEGRYDALQPTIFNYNLSQKKFYISSIMPDMKGEVRDAKWLSMEGGKKRLVVARNNDSLVFLKLAGQ